MNTPIAIRIPYIFMLFSCFYETIIFWRDRSENGATLPFCVIPVIAHISSILRLG